MHITSGTVTSLLDNLERKGYVVRSSDPGDRRRVLVDITPTAQGVLDEVLPGIQQVVRHLMERLGNQQIHELLDTLAEVRLAVTELPADLPDPQPRRRPEHLTR
jgi:MarR family 2-MHQ and catechol resistance regulon transcriptional repressor